MQKRALAAREPRLALLDLERVVDEAAHTTHAAELGAIHLAISPRPTGDITAALRGVMENLAPTHFETALARVRDSLRLTNRRDPRDLYDRFRCTNANLNHNPEILRKLAVLFASTMDSNLRTCAMGRFHAVDPKALASRDEAAIVHASSLATANRFAKPYPVPKYPSANRKRMR